MKILHLEDNPLDAELVNALVVRQWPDCQIRLVGNRQDFAAQLSAGAPDIILSDFTLAGFNGLEALALAREKAADTPFIFLSGTIGEDRAIEALKAGANDYIIKDRPKRLPTAIKRAIRDAQEQRERRAAEEQFLRVQRLESIGMLAAGIAHDFNNVLAPILMAAPLLRDRTTDPGDLRVLDNIERSAERGAGLVRQILGFAQGMRGSPQDIQLRHLMRDLIAVLGQTLPKAIRIEDHVAADLWPVCANPTHLHQILLNLCVNARDAMPRGGALSVRAENCPVDEVTAATMKNARPGAFVRIDIEDTGTGISPEVLERMWDPFFTTKEPGRGTGLGLSTVRGIVEDHHGFVRVITEPDRGTCFQVFLPASSEPAAPPQTGERSAAPRGNGELILVVDDEAGVREITAAILIRNGYKVLSAQDGTEALALLAPRAVEVRLVITDLNMPNLDGIALAKIVRSLSPTVRILTITGIADQYDRAEAEKLSGGLLTKPFTSDALLAATDRLLNSPIQELHCVSA